MSSNLFSSKKIDPKKSGWMQKSLVGLGVFAILGGLGFGIYNAAGNSDTIYRANQTKSSSHKLSHNEQAVPAFANKSQKVRKATKKSLATKKVKKKAKKVLAHGKKTSKKYASKTYKSKNKRASLNKSNKSHKKFAAKSKNSKQLKKSKRPAKQLAAK
jgi:hypothetical protein